MKQVFILTTAILVLIISCTSKIDFTANGSNVNSIYASDLMISEISTAINTDPNANRQRSHYVEIYNGTNASVDLSNYAIGYNAVTDTFTLANWNFSTAGSYIQLRKILDTGKCYVITSPISDLVKIKSDFDMLNGILQFTDTTNKDRIMIAKQYYDNLKQTHEYELINRYYSENYSKFSGMHFTEPYRFDLKLELKKDSQFTAEDDPHFKNLPWEQLNFKEDSYSIDANTRVHHDKTKTPEIIITSQGAAR